MAISNELAAAALAAVKAELDGGFLYIYSGAVPAAADSALDTDNEHTQLVQLSVGGDGVTGLTFATPTGPVMSKTPAEAWEGLVAFDGAEDSETELTPTFYRFCATGDDGRAADNGPRLQGTVGGPTSGASIILGTDTVTDNGVNSQGIGIFTVPLAAA